MSAQRTSKSFDDGGYDRDTYTYAYICTVFGGVRFKFAFLDGNPLDNVWMVGVTLEPHAYGSDMLSYKFKICNSCIIKKSKIHLKPKVTLHFSLTEYIYTGSGSEIKQIRYCDEFQALALT